MIHRINRMIAYTTREEWSKFTDGILAALIMVLVWETITLVIPPIENSLGKPGLLVYALGLLAVAMASFQQALFSHHNEIMRARLGIAGGFFAWAVAEVSSVLGLPIFPNLAGMVIFMMVTLIIGLLWRVLPLGARFFSLVLILNWMEYIFLSIQQSLAPLSPVLSLSFRAVGIGAVFLAVLVIGWILFRTRRRMQRVSGAVALWFLIGLAARIFSSGIF